MTWTLIRKSIHDSWLLLASCVGGLILFCWVRVWIVSQLEVGRFQKILENLPPAVQKLIPVPIQDLLTYEGRIAFSFEEPIVYLIMAVWAIARGSDVVSGEVGRGTLEMLAAQPVSRSQLMTTQGLVSVWGATVLAAAAIAGTWFGLLSCSTKVVDEPVRWTVPGLNVEIPLSAETPREELVPMWQLIDERLLSIAATNYASLGIFLIGLSMCVSAADRYRWRTIGLVVAFYVAQTLVELLGQSLGSVWLKRLTFFTGYEPVNFVTSAARTPESAWAFWATPNHPHPWGLGPVGCDLVLIGLGFALFSAGLVIFSRRDLPAPT